MNKLTRNQWVAVFVGLVVVGASYITGQSLISVFGTNKDNMSMENEKMSANVGDAMPQSQPTSLQSTDIVVGTGAEAKAGNMVTVNYVGAFTDGKVFDASANHGQPFTFTLGAGQVIKGWDMGVQGMKVGGKRQLIIPSDLGYGDLGYPGAIPGKATLVFEVELLEVK